MEPINDQLGELIYCFRADIRNNGIEENSFNLASLKYYDRLRDEVIAMKS